MIQKILKVGSSLAVTIPKSTAEELGWQAGDRVAVESDAVTDTVSIRPARKGTLKAKRIAALALNFIERYRSDLEALAHK